MTTSHSYTGTGGAITGGCASVERYIYIQYMWGENSIVYVKKKAQRGILERVAIKRVILNQNALTWNQVIPIYVDTYNCLWNENDLVTETDARAYALNYLTIQQELIEANHCRIK